MNPDITSRRVEIEAFFRKLAFQCLRDRGLRDRGLRDPNGGIGTGTDKILASCRSFSGAEKLALVEFPRETKEEALLVSHISPGENSNILLENLQQASPAVVSWLSEAIQRGETIAVNSLEVLPSIAAELGKLLEKSRVSAFAASPLILQNRTAGFVFATWETPRQKFTEDEELLFSYMGSFFESIVRPSDRTGEQREERFQSLERVVGDADAAFRNVVESLSHGIIICDAEGRVVYTNPSIEKMLGYCWNEVKGKYVYEFFFGNDPAVHLREKRRQEKRYADRLAGVAEEYEVLVTQKNGDKCWLETKASPLRNVHGEIVGSIGVNADVTERKVLEAQVLWSQKMDAVGRLAGGVAHDFNNLLTVISGYASFISQKMDDDDPNQRRIEAISDATAMACSLTQQLLTLSRRQVVQSTAIAVNELLRNSESIIRGLLGDGIVLELNYGDDTLAVQADSGQLQQVLINLIINARDAMPGGGALNISICSHQASEEIKFDRSVLPAGDYSVIEVTDSGIGISDIVAQRLFDPFFSTKPNGTGLGLSTAYGIITRHNGEIAINSELGKGSTFRVFLPALEDMVVALESPQEDRRLHGDECILLVEDEDAVRGLICEVLQEAGYTVIEAVDGENALEVLHSSVGSSIDLLLTDIAMPGMSGFDLAEHTLRSLSELRLKILMMSGCTQDSTIPENITRKGILFIAKPFDPSTLLAKLREVFNPASIDEIVRIAT